MCNGRRYHSNMGLQSPNLLVDRHWRVKVTDFNLSRITEAPANVQSSVLANNPRWMAPEVIQSQLYTASSDVYAFGLIMWELACWETPFGKLSAFQIMLSVGQQGIRPEVPGPGTLRGGPFEGYVEYVALMQACWAQAPEQRPTFDQVSLRAPGNHSMAQTEVKVTHCRSLLHSAALWKCLRGPDSAATGLKLLQLLQLPFLPRNPSSTLKTVPLP
jgi:serine/threonine protein kinase